MNNKLKTLLLIMPLVMTGCGSSGGKSEKTSSQQTSSQQQSSAQSQEQSSEKSSEASQQASSEASQEASSEASQELSSEEQSQEVSSEASQELSSEQSEELSSEELSSEAQSSEASQAASSEEESSGTDIDTVHIRFWHTFGQTVVDAVQDKIEKFQDLVYEHEGMNVEIELSYQGSYDDIATKIYNGFAVGNIPTIAVAYPDNVADYLEAARADKKDYVVDLNDFIESDYGFGNESWLGDAYDESDFVPEFFEEGRHYIFDGTFSLPFMKSTEVMFYNYDLLEEAMKYYNPDLNTERKITDFMSDLTWDKFMELCQSIADNKDKISNLLEIPAYYDSDGNLFITKMFQEEIPYSSIDDNQKGVIDFSQEPYFTETIDMLKDLRAIGPNGNNLMTTKGVVNKYGSDYFTNEKTIFSIGSSGGAGYNFPEQDAFTLGICRVPYSNDNPLYVSQGPTLCMFNNDAISEAENDLTKLYAWRFLKYITNAQINTELCINGSEGYIPVRYSAYESALFQQFMEEGEKYAQCYKVVLNDINNDAGYLVTSAFKGSAELRDQGASLVTGVLNAKSDDAIQGLLQTAIDNALLKM